MGRTSFDEGETSVKRRGFRSARRRTQRKRERLALLEALFDEEICKKDCTFFRRLHESDLWPEDKSGDDKYAVLQTKIIPIRISTRNIPRYIT